jgi:CRP-like cAMP-binding protein
MSDEKALRKARAKLDKALEANKNDEAIDWLAELVKHEPSNARWPHKRGDLLRKLGRNEEAVECYATAVGLYADQGFIGRAVAMAKTVVTLDPARLDILERVDPNAAQLLRAQTRPAKAARHPMLLDDDAAPPAAAKPAGTAAKRHPMLLDDDDAPPAAAMPASTAAKRHPMLLEDDAPPPAAANPAGTSAKRHPMVLEDDDVPPPASKAGVASSKRHPMVLDDDDVALPPPAAKAAVASPKRHPMILDDDDAAPPPAATPLRKAPAPAAPGPAVPRAKAALPPAAPRRPASLPITLDRLSLPPAFGSVPSRAVTRADSSPEIVVADIYSRALAGIDELLVDPSAPSNLVRFSDAPPRAALDVALSEIELEPRACVPELESLRPEPPAAAQLAKLPLFPLFAEVPQAALALMIAGSELIELAHGDYVVRQGDDGDALYGVLEGSVEVSVPGQDSRSALAEGDVFGEACLLEDERAHADIVVHGTLVALRVPRDVLLDVLQYHPPLAELLLELLTRRLLGNLLQSSPLFQEFDAAGRQELAGLFEIRRAAAGTLLSVVGKRMDGLYISLTGTLAIHEPGAPERIGPPGSMFGQNSLLSQELAQVDVKTRVNMIVLRLPAVQFTRVAMQYPTILARLTELSTSEVVKVTL